MSEYNGTIFNHYLQPAKGMSHERSGLTALARQTGKIRLDCPICGISFERYACHARKSKVCYCGKGCADEAKRRPVEVTCVECGVVFISIPAEVSRGKYCTCSKSCRSIHRKKLVLEGITFKNINRLTRLDGNGKITAKQASEIAQSQELTSALSERYKVSATTVRNIRRAARKVIA